MIGVLEDDHVLAAGARAGEAQRQLVGLAAGGDEVAHPQRLREAPREPLGIPQDRVVQVASVRVEEGQLLLRRPDDARVGVAHERHVVVDVEVGPARLVVEVLREAAHDLERPPVGDGEVPAEEAAARGERLRGGGLRRGEALRGDAQEEVRVRGEARPDRPLAREGHAGEVRVLLQEIEDHLEVEVRRPVAVHGRGADPRDRLSRLHALADREGEEGIPGQVAVERVERRAVPGLVAEDDERPVVLGGGVVREDVYDAGQRRADRRLRLDEEVDPEVDGAPLVGGPPTRAEEARHVDPARLVVPPHADRDACALHLVEDPLGERAGLGGLRVGAEEGAAHAQVEDEAGRGAEVHVQHRRRPRLLEPRDDGRASGDGREPARLAEDVVGETRVHAVQALERLPGGGLAHRDVGVAGRVSRPHRRAGHAHREARPGEREQQPDLLLPEREGGVVARDDRGGGGQRVVLAEERVRGRDRGLRDEEPVVHVAEIEEAGHRAGEGTGRAHEDVVVVGVAVDDAAPQAGERRRDLGLVTGERPLDEGPPCRVLHVVERAADPRGAGEVPLEVAVGLGVLEARERLVHLAEEPAEAEEQLRAARAGLGQRRPRQPGEHPHEPGRAVRARDGGRGVAAERGHDARQGQVRGALREVPERRTLQLHEPPLARGVHGLQDEEPAVG